MKLIGEVEIENDYQEDIKLLVNLFEILKEMNRKITKLEEVCSRLEKAVAEGDPVV